MGSLKACRRVGCCRLHSFDVGKLLNGLGSFLFCRELRDLVDYAGIEKVLFGTDDPINRVVRPTKEWVQLIRDLPDNAPDGIEFTREEVDAILGGNAVAVLGL